MSRICGEPNPSGRRGCALRVLGEKTHQRHRSLDGDTWWTPTDAQINAAIDVLLEELSIPVAANVDDYVESPTEPPEGPERDAAWAALRAADEKVMAQSHALIRRALIAAMEAGS